MDPIIVYDIYLTIHIVAVHMGLGPIFALPVLGLMAERRGAATTAFALRVAIAVERVLVWPGLAIVLITGVLLIFHEVPGHSADMPTWLWVGIAWFAVILLLVWLDGRLIHRTVQLLERHEGQELPPGYGRSHLYFQVVGGIIDASVVGMVFLMYWQPDW